MKKITLLFLVCVLLVSFTTNVFAAPNKMSPQLQMLIKDYNLKVVDQFPEGVKPVEYKSVEEAAAALEKIKNASKLSVENADKNTETAKAAVVNPTNEALTDFVGIAATGYQTYSVFHPPFYKNLDVYYNYAWNGYRNVFTSCTNVSSYITGVTLGFTWTQTGSLSSILDGGRTLYARANARLDHYLIVEGVGTIYTTQESIDNYFYNS